MWVDNFNNADLQMKTARTHTQKGTFLFYCHNKINSNSEDIFLHVNIDSGPGKGRLPSYT